MLSNAWHRRELNELLASRHQIDPLGDDGLLVSNQLIIYHVTIDAVVAVVDYSLLRLAGNLETHWTSGASNDVPSPAGTARNA